MRADLIYLNLDGKGPRIYLIGGCILDQQCTYIVEWSSFLCSCPASTGFCEYFTPETEEWFSCPGAPRPRSRHISVVVDNKIYLFGGRTSPEDVLITEVDVFDPVEGKWTTPFSWGNATSDGVAFATGSDIVYFAGGYSQNYSTPGEVSSLNVTSGEWRYDHPAMTTARGDISVATNDSVNFYVMGGFSGDNFCSTSNVSESFNVQTNTWTLRPHMLHPRGDPSIGVLNNNFFALGGETIAEDCAYSVPVRYVTRFNVAEQSWTSEDYIPYDIFRFAGVSYETASSKAIYLFGGQESFVVVDSNTGYYPLSDKLVKYVPTSIGGSAETTKTLDAGAIAGIIIGIFVFTIVGLLGFRLVRARVSYLLLYWKILISMSTVCNQMLSYR
jgi:hypothetical protein